MASGGGGREGETKGRWGKAGNKIRCSTVRRTKRSGERSVPSPPCRRLRSVLLDSSLLRLATRPSCRSPFQNLPLFCSLCSIPLVPDASSRAVPSRTLAKSLLHLTATSHRMATIHSLPREILDRIIQLDLEDPNPFSAHPSTLATAALVSRGGSRRRPECGTSSSSTGRRWRGASRRVPSVGCSGRPSWDFGSTSGSTPGCWSESWASFGGLLNSRFMDMMGVKRTRTG